MKKFLLTIIIAVLAVPLPACSSEEEVSSKEQTIIEYALADLDEEGEATLELVSIKSVPWLDWDCADYILSVNGKSYRVNVQEKGDEVHFVDVIEEIYGNSGERRQLKERL